MTKFIVAIVSLLVSFAASAAIIGSAHSSRGDRIDLHDQRGTCPENTRRAVYFVAQDGSSVEGCWALAEGRVLLAFEDGDRYNFPRELFAWVEPKNARSCG